MILAVVVWNLEEISTNVQGDSYNIWKTFASINGFEATQNTWLIIILSSRSLREFPSCFLVIFFKIPDIYNSQASANITDNLCYLVALFKKLDRLRSPNSSPFISCETDRPRARMDYLTFDRKEQVFAQVSEECSKDNGREREMNTFATLHRLDILHVAVEGFSSNVILDISKGRAVVAI